MQCKPVIFNYFRWWTKQFHLCPLEAILEATTLFCHFTSTLLIFTLFGRFSVLTSSPLRKSGDRFCSFAPTASLAFSACLCFCRSFPRANFKFILPWWASLLFSCVSFSLQSSAFFLKKTFFVLFLPFLCI
jgi:hypothetical protein